MAAQKVLTQGTTPGTQLEVSSVDTSAGAGDAGKLVALDAGGRLASNMMPVGIAPETVTAVAMEALSAGDFVHIVNDGGTKSVQKALGTDSTKPATGFVLDAVSEDDPATVYTEGYNNRVTVGSFVAADLGKEVCLSASTGGACTLTVPTGSGNIVQPLGKIIDVGVTYVTVEFETKTIVTRA